MQSSTEDIVIYFPINCPEGALMQTKLVRDLWVLSKSWQTNSWSSSFHSQPSPYPHTPRLEFPVDGLVQTPTLLWKTYFEDEHERQKKKKTTEQKCMSWWCLLAKSGKFTLLAHFTIQPCQRDRLLLKLHENTSGKYTNITQENRSCGPGYKKGLIVMIEYWTER